ncbi:hypothetical protein FGRA07_11395 [Fusarium graminearum]|uniref:Uncharacterized protein n=1 Tax=Gibberella zeae TaxID=5518 RepID=A0A2H3GGF4_GIBZA|nr:hypothetical protein FGRA07_11395 [Fusarium graminearum]
MTGEKERKNLLIVRNDGPDADNIAAFMLMYQWAKGKPDVELVIIFEPRGVNCGLRTLKHNDQDSLDSLLKAHFSHVGFPIEIRLKGLLTEQHVEKVENISEEDRELLRMAIKDSQCSVGDSQLHALLIARDLAKCLSETLGASEPHAKFTILVDNDGLPKKSPVNLTCHAPEHLFTRTPKGINEFYRSMGLDMPQRREEIEKWYRECIREADEKLPDQGFSIDELDLEGLKEKITAAKDVTFIEGASLKLLSRLLDDPEVAAKMDCFVQAGTLDLAVNIFNDQFNIALDPESAECVLHGYKAFKSFTAVPSQTSQAIAFSVDNLEDYGFCGLARWTLSLNLRNDPAKVSDGTVTLKDQHCGEKVKLPDLAMLLLAFWPEKYPSEKTQVVLPETGSGPLLFRITDSDGIRILLPKTGHTYEPVDLADILTNMPLNDAGGNNQLLF